MKTECSSKDFDLFMTRDQEDICNALMVEEKIAREPNDWEALDSRADILCSMKMYGLALQNCDISLRINPINALAFITKGDALCGLGKYAEALDCYNKAMEIEPLFMKICFMRKRAAEKATLIPNHPRNEIYQLQSERDKAREDAESLRHNLDNFRIFMKLKDEEIAFLKRNIDGRTDERLSKAEY